MVANNPKGFKWDISANLTSVANKILQLPNSDKPNNQLDGYEVADGTKKDANGKQITKWIGGYAEGGKLVEIIDVTDSAKRTVKVLDSHGNVKAVITDDSITL